MAAADEKISEFIAFTGASPEHARSYLEMAAGDLQQAVSLYMEMEGGGGGGRGDAIPAGDAAPAGGDDEVRAPIAAFDDQIINAEDEQRRMQDAIRRDADAMGRRMAFDREEDAVAGNWACTKCSNQNFAKRTNCFNCGAPKGAAGAGGGGKANQAINELFRAPEYNEASPFFQSIERAKSEGKWLLVNIQQAEAFASHVLNRDVWRDETLQDLVTGNFVFWQRDNQSHEGSQFCQTYKCGEELPHICIVDPRTGRSVKTWKPGKFSDAALASEYLLEFMDRFPAPSAPGALPRATQPAAPSLPSPSAAGPPAESPTPGPGRVLSGDGGGSAAAAPAAAPTPTPEARADEDDGPVAEMPEEPAADVEHVRVSLRLPSGQRATRRFRPSDTLEVLFAVASALSGKPPDTLDVSTQMPKRSLRDAEGGLAATVKDAKVGGNMLLIETGKRRRETQQ